MSQDIESLFTLLARKTATCRNYVQVDSRKLMAEAAQLERFPSQLAAATHAMEGFGRYADDVRDTTLEIIKWCDDHGVDCPAFRQLHATPGIASEPDGSELFDKWEKAIAVDMAAIREAAKRGGGATPAAINSTPRRGRLPKTESEALKMRVLSEASQNRSLLNDIPKLAKLVGTGHKNVRRILKAENDEFKASRAYRPKPKK
jgi:hypothetical protein